MKTHEDHVRRVLVKHGEQVRVVGRYEHSHKKIEYFCSRCAVKWLASPSNVEQGTGCPYCSHIQVTHDDHVLAVHAVHGDCLAVAGLYTGAHHKITYRCRVHGEFEAKPANVVHRQSGCPRCYHETVGPRTRKTHEVYVEEAKQYGAEPLDNYVTALTKIRHRCTQGHVWDTAPNQVLSGYGCPLCDRSQYRRHAIRVGRREVLVQGAEGKAVGLLLAEGVKPGDIAFTAAEGRPVVTYRDPVQQRMRKYTPDMLIRSTNTVIEVKSEVTLGVYDASIYKTVRAKAKAVLAAGYNFRLMVIRKNASLALPECWHKLSWRSLVTLVKGVR